MHHAETLLPPNSPPLPTPETIRLSDGAQINYRLWRPAGALRGLVIALHGIQSHSGWYGASSAALANAGYAVAFLDRRGSGINLDHRGDAPHVDRLVNDVVQVLSAIERRGVAATPKVLLAISWGGKLASLIAARRPELFDGLALLTPGLCTLVRANVIQRTALRAADTTGMGHRALAIPLDDATLFTDQRAYQDFIRQDPLTLRTATARFLRISLDIDAELRRAAHRVQCPLLLMLAGRDRIVDNQATQRLVASFGSDRKTVIEYPQATHTLEFERDRERCFQDLQRWLDGIVEPFEEK